MKKKNINIKYFIIGIIILFAILMGITAHHLDDTKNLNFFEKTIKDSVTFVEKVVYAPVSFVKEKIEVFTETKKLYKKYTKLKEKVEKTELYYAQIEELQKEVTELKSILDLNSTLSEYSYVNSTVVNRNIGYWYNTITIDKGSKNNISKGDAVITNEGLIGKVIKVSNFSSTVKLLTSDEIDNKISIKIKTETDKCYGLLSGYDYKKNVYKIEGITNTKEIKEGDLVTTTGLTDYFPSGLLIGYVKNIVKDEYDLNSVIEVTPSVSFNDVSIVTILNRKAKE